jgi:hypothetical protein
MIARWQETLSSGRPRSARAPAVSCWTQFEARTAVLELVAICLPDYRVMITGIPISPNSQKNSASASIIPMQPWLAG